MRSCADRGPCGEHLCLPASRTKSFITANNGTHHRDVRTTPAPRPRRVCPNQVLASVPRTESHRLLKAESDREEEGRPLASCKRSSEGGGGVGGAYSCSCCGGARGVRVDAGQAGRTPTHAREHLDLRSVARTAAESRLTWSCCALPLPSADGAGAARGSAACVRAGASTRMRAQGL